MKTEKQCTKCGEVKSLKEFYFQKQDNCYRGECKECRRSYLHLWGQIHKLEIRERKRNYNQIHRLEIQERHSQYYQTHKNKWKLYYRFNKDKHHKSTRLYYQTHKLEAQKYQRQYRQTPAGKLIRRNAAHRRRALKKDGNITLAQWNAIKLQQKYKCYWCKRRFKDSELTIDHVIPLSKGGVHDISNTVAACKPCNLSKQDKIWSLM